MDDLSYKRKCKELGNELSPTRLMDDAFAMQVEQRRNVLAGCACNETQRGSLKHLDAAIRKAQVAPYNPDDDLGDLLG